MRGKQNWNGVLMLGLVAVLLLSLPFAAAAQTTTTGSASTEAATTNGISNPKEGAALSGTVEVRGYASSPDFMKWQLDLLPNGDPSAATFLAFGETPGAFTYSFDTSNLPSGEHALRLRVVRQDSNYDEFMTHFTIGKAAAGGAATGAAATGGAATGATTGTTATATTGTAAATGAGVTTNGLATPREGQNISGQFVVSGYASDPNFMKWQLDLLPNGDPNSAGFLAFGETSGVFTYTLDTTTLPAGQHALRLRVVRNDSNYSEYTTNFTIGKAAATGAATTGGAAGTASGGTTAATTPSTSGTTSSTASGGTGAAAGVGVTTNGLAAPTEGQSISGQFVVKGYANDPNFMRWQLDLLPNGDATQAAFLAIGETAGVFTYTLDTTNWAAGEHALRLRVVRSDSNYSEYTTPFKIAK